MGRNATDTDWYSTPRELRHRKPIALTLSEEARAKLQKLATKLGKSRSQVVEELILRAR